MSKELENDADNIDAILDAAYAHPAFTDDKVLGMLLAFPHASYPRKIAPTGANFSLLFGQYRV